MEVRGRMQGRLIRRKMKSRRKKRNRFRRGRRGLIRRKWMDGRVGWKRMKYRCRRREGKQWVHASPEQVILGAEGVT